MKWVEVAKGYEVFRSPSSQVRFAVIESLLILGHFNLTSDLVAFYYLGFTPEARKLRSDHREVARKFGHLITAVGSADADGRVDSWCSPLLGLITPVELRPALMEEVRKAICRPVGLALPTA